MIKCVTLKCPRCSSTSHVHLNSIPSEEFLCPVCSEGEIRTKPNLLYLNGGEHRIHGCLDDLAVIWSVAR